MTRREVLALTLFALLLVVGGVVWMFGALGLVASGAGLFLVSLFGVNIEGEAAKGGEAVASHKRSRRRAAL